MECHVFGRGVGAGTLEEIGETHTTPLADRAPSFNADVPRHLAFLRQRAQFFKRPYVLALHQSTDRQLVSRCVYDRYIVDVIERVEREWPRDHRLGISRRELVR